MRTCSTPTSPIEEPILIPSTPTPLPSPQQKPEPQLPPRKVSIIYNGRNVIDLAGNLIANKKVWQFQYAHLPENNLQMFLSNRSQYHRLGATGHIQEYVLTACNDCTFQYPMTGQQLNCAHQSVGNSFVAPMPIQQQQSHHRYNNNPPVMPNQNNMYNNNNNSDNNYNNYHNYNNNNNNDTNYGNNNNDAVMKYLRAQSVASMKMYKHF